MVSLFFARVAKRLERFKQFDQLRLVFLSGFFLANVIALAGTGASMFFGYLYNLLMPRMLSKAEYGELSVLMGAIMIATVPGMALQTILTREIAKLEAKGKKEEVFLAAKSFMKLIFEKVSIAALVFIAALWVVSFFFQHPYILYIQIIALFAPFGYALFVVNAYLQGRERILTLSILYAANPFLKVVFAVALVFLGLGFFGAFMSLHLPTLLLMLAFIAYFFFFKQKTGGQRTKKQSQETETRLKQKQLHIPQIHLGNSFFPVLFTSVLLMLFIYLDLFAVRFFLSPEEAAYYNVAGITSRILYFIVGGLVLVFLPKSSKLDFTKDKKQLALLFAKTTLFLAPIFVLFMLIPTQFISFFYTEKYLPAVQPFIILSIAMFAYALFFLLLNLLWSQRKEKFPLIASVLAVVVDVLLLAFLTPKYGMIGAAASTLASSVLLLLASVAYLLTLSKGGFLPSRKN